MTCPLCNPKDEEVLLSTDAYRIIVVNDEESVAAFCRVIWNQHVAELTDLSEDERAQLMNGVYRLEMAMREVLRPDKINLASLGNMVPHLHWHVIARFHNDAHFPLPIWAPLQQKSHVKLPNDWIQRVKNILLENS